MNYQEPLKISSIDLSKIVYPKCKTNDNKKIMLIKYNEKGRLKNFVFQTPTLLKIDTVQTTKGYTEIELALVGKEKNKADKVDKFVKFLNQLEHQIKTDAQFNASEWFNNVNDDDDVINFQKIIRDSTTYSKGTLKLKIIANNDFETVLQINNSKKISVGSIPDNSWCKLILECYAVWINSANNFGIFLRPILISFTPRDVYNYKFVDDSEEENEFDIPDTDVNTNIFMNIDKNIKPKYNEETSQLELNDLVNHLESDLKPVESTVQLDIDLTNGYFSKSSDSSSESVSDNSDNIDAETSDN